jgi:hypothetical protein
MDPVSIAAAVVAAVTPYLAKAAGKFAESAGSAAFEQGGKLFEKLKARFAAAPAETKQLQDLQADPADTLNQAAVQKLLRDALKNDPAFMAEIASLLNPVGSGQSNQFHVQAGRIGKVTNVGNVQGNVNIGDGRDDE